MPFVESFIDDSTPSGLCAVAAVRGNVDPISWLSRFCISASGEFQKIFNFQPILLSQESVKRRLAFVLHVCEQKYLRSRFL
jgi:hypothetical protein